MGSACPLLSVTNHNQFAKSNYKLQHEIREKKKTICIFCSLCELSVWTPYFILKSLFPFVCCDFCLSLYVFPSAFCCTRVSLTNEFSCVSPFQLPHVGFGLLGLIICILYSCLLPFGFGFLIALLSGF